MRLYIVRHGQKATTDPDYDGGPNPPLTETGERQAEHLAEFMAGEDLDCLYSSCQLRSLQTANAVYRQIDQEWHVWPVFCESNRTQWAALRANEPERAAQLAAWRIDEAIETPTENEIAENDGNYYLLSSVTEKFSGTRLSQPFPWPEAWWELRAGETRSMGYARVELGLQALVDRHDDGDRVAVVCHGNVGDKMMTTLMDFPRRHQPRRFGFDNTGVSRLDRREGDRWRIEYANRTAHLPAEIQV